MHIRVISFGTNWWAMRSNEFAKSGWKSAGVRPISISLRGERYEAMLLFGAGDWVESDLGRWQVVQAECRIRLNEVSEGALP
jgi:hypothetical protein